MGDREVAGRAGAEDEPWAATVGATSRAPAPRPHGLTRSVEDDADEVGAGVPWAGEALGLVGRDALLQQIRVRLTDDRRVVAVLGIAGAGKTAVLSAAARCASAEGWRVLRVGGHVTERMLPFATLLDLLDAGEAAARFDGLDGQATRAGAGAAHRSARLLRECLLSGEAEADSVDALRLRRDVQQWLLQLAGDLQLAVIVDDAQWVDAASWSVLAFLANRAPASGVSFLVASRDVDTPPGLWHHTGLSLEPLGEGEAMRLLHRGTPTLDQAGRVEVVERAAGNPLALLELARATAADGPATRFPSAGSTGSRRSGLELPAAVEAAFASELPLLPAQTRDVLLLVAAGEEDLRLLAAATGGTATLPDLLEPAERLGLVRVTEQRVQFRHPLIGSAVYSSATARERATAHTTLSHLYPVADDRHVWHLASASTGPDESVAAALVGVAQRWRARGAGREAGEAMARAAELSADPALREERLLEGIALTASAGRLGRLTALAEELRSETSDPLVRARAGHFLAYAVAQSMRQATARDMLQTSLEELIHLDPGAGWASLTTLASLTYQTCRGREALGHWLERYDVETRGLGDDPVVRAARAWIRAALDPLAGSEDDRRLVLEAPVLAGSTSPGPLVAAHEMLLGATAWLLGEHRVALERLSRASDLMQRSGPHEQLIQTTMALGQVQFDMGQYQEADGSARLMQDLAEAEGLVYYVGVGRELRARVTALTGEPARAVEEVDALFASLEIGEAAAFAANLHVAKAFALTRLQDHEGAYQQLRSLFDVAGEPLHPHVATRSLGHLVSAAVRLGRDREVVPIVRRTETALGDRAHGPSDDRSDDQLGRVLSRARALLADDLEAEPHFQQAVRATGEDRWPFERANAQLEYGAWLRRRHRALDARTQLRAAAATFDRIGAVSWSRAAARELRAAGVHLDRPDDATARWAQLTAQEREIVTLAAKGLTNREIGGTLFLSPRTVSAHLYHAFPKLGVTSRTQLRDIVDRFREGR